MIGPTRATIARAKTVTFFVCSRMDDDPRGAGVGGGVSHADPHAGTGLLATGSI